MNNQDLFESDEKLNDFYNRLAGIAEMAVSKYANLMLTPILQETAKWAHEHKDAITKLQAMGSDIADKASKSEQAGALDEKAQEKQETQTDTQVDVSKGCPDVDCASVSDHMPNCS